MRRSFFEVGSISGRRSGGMRGRGGRHRCRGARHRCRGGRHRCRGGRHRCRGARHRCRGARHRCRGGRHRCRGARVVSIARRIKPGARRVVSIEIRVAQRAQLPPKPPIQPEPACARAKLAEIQRGGGAAAPPGRAACHGRARERERAGEPASSPALRVVTRPRRAICQKGPPSRGSPRAARDASHEQGCRGLLPQRDGAFGGRRWLCVGPKLGCSSVAICPRRRRAARSCRPSPRHTMMGAARALQVGELGQVEKEDATVRGEGHGAERSSSEERPEFRERC